MRYLLYIFFIISFFSSCSRVHAPYNDIQIGAMKVNHSLMAQIDSYRKTHPNIKSIVILTNIDLYLKKEWGDMHHYFLIAPAYQDIAFMTGHTPSLYFHYNDTHVFIQSSLDGLLNSNSDNELYNHLCIKKDHREENILIHELFFEDAYVLDKTDADSIIFVSDKAYYYLAKKRVKFVPPPVRDCDIKD